MAIQTWHYRLIHIDNYNKHMIVRVIVKTHKKSLIINEKL